jgi:hypothetical protein
MFKLEKEANQCWETLQSLGNPRGLRSIASLAIDFNRTHAPNSAWPGRARFRVVWRSVTIALLAGVELILIWSHALSEINVLGAVPDNYFFYEVGIGWSGDAPASTTPSVLRSQEPYQGHREFLESDQASYAPFQRHPGYPLPPLLEAVRVAFQYTSTKTTTNQIDSMGYNSFEIVL